MKKLLLLSTLFWISIFAFPQTQIATSNHSVATYGHNQRKIVRDWQENIYVVYTDVVEDDIVIMGLRYDQASEAWSTPQFIISGNAPTLAIDQDDKIMMVYKTNDPEPKINYISTLDFTNWEDPIIISFNDYEADMPVADVDSTGILNVLWIDHGNDPSDTRLCYAGIIEDTLIENKVVLNKENIWDISIANHLQYGNNSLFFAIEYWLDTVEFYHSSDHLESIEMLYSNTALFPCITYNSVYPTGWGEEHAVRFLMAKNNVLYEVESGVFGFEPIEHYLYGYQGSFVCIDNIAPPLGYSFLFLNNDKLKHGFSYGSMWNWTTVMSSITGEGEISNPNIAYKHFNPLVVDFIWMENSNDGYNIMYMRDDKYQPMPGINDEEAGKGFSLTGKPNPFSQSIILKVIAEGVNNNQSPHIEIFNIQSHQVAKLDPYQKDFLNSTGETRFLYLWDGTTSTGMSASPGIYLVRCSYNHKRVVRKIVFEP
ncbi:MAG: hypothetical protein KQI35_03095 [Bacteroidetes bacterium]|nr:hypothetical protein [Bacteroidota bacterium]